MSRRACWWSLLLLAGSVGRTYPAVARADEAGADRPVITPREPGSSYFGGDDVALCYTVSFTEPIDCRARWSFSVDQRVVARGEAPLALRPGGPAEFTLKFKAPAVKEGLVLAGDMLIRTRSKASSSSSTAALTEIDEEQEIFRRRAQMAQEWCLSSWDSPLFPRQPDVNAIP
jgi:hypothetical protein